LDKQRLDIPSFELIHEGQTADFVFKKIQDGVNVHGYKEEVPHRHNYYTVMWAIEMSGKHVIDYKEYNIQNNNIFFVSPEQVHQVLLGKNQNGILLMFTCNFLDRHFINKKFISDLGLFSEISESPPLVIDHESAIILKGFTNEIIKSFSSADIYKFEKIGAWLKLFLIECNKFAPNLKSDNPQALQSAKSILIRFKDLLETNFKTWRQVIDYANELNISPDYLNTVIKNTVGKTAKELIQQRIVLESKRLGLHTELSTKEIAYNLGFDDPSHFSHFFKNVENQSFSDFKLGIEKFLYK
jgi:AraC family transcriptional regulator, transcriptional activator of pobA